MKFQGSIKKVQILALLSIILVLILGVSSYSADKNAINTADVGMGARPIALGGAYVGIADDASAVFTNPGGLGLQKRFSAVSMSTQLLTCVDYRVAGLVWPTAYGNFGFGYIGVTCPAGDHIYMDGGVTVEEGAMYYSNDQYILSYGRDISDWYSETVYFEKGKVKNLGFGANIKLFSQGLNGDIRNAPAADGLELDLGILHKPDDRLTLGATLQNAYRGREGSSIAWSTGQSETLPTVLKLGCSYMATDNVMVALDTDTFIGVDRKMMFHGGCEWQLMPALALRGGFDQREESIDDRTIGVATYYSLGVGLTLNGFRFDYAYRQDINFTELSSHYFSFSFCAEPPAKPAAEKSTLTRYENMIDNQENTAQTVSQ